MHNDDSKTHTMFMVPSFMSGKKSLKLYCLLCNLWLYVRHEIERHQRPGLMQNLNLLTNLKLEYNIKFSIIFKRTLDFKPGSYFIDL